MKIKDIFCTNCQTVTSHKAEIDQNGEFVFTCLNLIGEVECGRFVKFPTYITKEQFNEGIAKIETDNAGQVSVEVQEAILDELLS